jgi:ribokinase
VPPRRVDVRTAVVGHVEWVTFAYVRTVPDAGDIVHAADVLDVPAGGGPVAAVQLAKLAGECTLYTALGDDELGHRAKAELEGMGVRVEAAFRSEPQRRAFVHVDISGERTITVLGSRLDPRGGDPLPWDGLDGTDALYFCAGDVDALRQARRSRVLVATARERETIAGSGVRFDAVVGSRTDPSERFDPDAFEVSPLLSCWTESEHGGRYASADGSSGRWKPLALKRRGDTYGAGDSFAAGLTYGLGRGLATDGALELAACCGAACVEGLGPYEGQLTATGL